MPGGCHDILLLLGGKVLIVWYAGCPKKLCPICVALWRSCRFNYLGFYTVACFKFQLRV